MKVLAAWLRELAPVAGGTDELAALLNDLGLAVDDVVPVGAGVPGVVVAEVLETRRHPDAEKVWEVFVDTGSGVATHVWCGAFNMAAGDLVPLATIGTRMPDGRDIAKRKILGVASEGMLCSSRELGLGEDHTGILILPPGLPLGADVFEALGIRPDVVFDLDLTRNRPDAWCHLGVARDLAARQGVALTPPPCTGVEPVGASTGLTVRIDAPEMCGRFTAWRVSGVAVAPSPRWMAERLSASGMRPINNVVDASNYVMLELGQPNHPYDESRLGGGGFIVRRARSGEAMVTLDDVERTFTTDDLLICDANDAPIGVAGIMGGANTEISPTTTTVALEMAWFQPESTAATAARLGLRSEAGARFERGCDWEVIDLAARRFVDLLRLTSPGATLHGVVDARGDLPDRTPVAVRLPRVNGLLGLDLTDADVKALLDPIGFTTTPEQHEPDVLRVALPTWRVDTTTEVEVIEEVARLYGYSRIPRGVPASVHPGLLSPYQRDRRLVREVLVGCGLAEVMPNPFLAPGDLARCGLADEPVTITNPLVAEESVLRTSLLPGVVRTLAYNASHRRGGLGLFEVGRVWRRPPVGQALPDEHERVAAAVGGADAHRAVGLWRELVAALAVDGLALVRAERPGLHPTRTAAVVGPDGAELGVVGEVDPGVAEAWGIDERVAWFEVDLDRLLALPHGERPYRRISRFPSSDVDLAFVVPAAVPAADVEATLRAAGAGLVTGVRLFDTYRGAGVPDGSRSLAYTLRIQAPDRTLTDVELADVRRRAIDAVEAAHGARLRG